MMNLKTPLNPFSAYGLRLLSVLFSNTSVIGQIRTFESIVMSLKFPSAL